MDKNKNYGVGLEFPRVSGQEEEPRDERNGLYLQAITLKNRENLFWNVLTMCRSRWKKKKTLMLF